MSVPVSKGGVHTDAVTFGTTVNLKVFLPSEAVVRFRACFQGGGTHRRSNVWSYYQLPVVK